MPWEVKAGTAAIGHACCMGRVLSQVEHWPKAQVGAAIGRIVGSSHSRAAEERMMRAASPRNARCLTAVHFPGQELVGWPHLANRVRAGCLGPGVEDLVLDILDPLADVPVHVVEAKTIGLLPAHGLMRWSVFGCTPTHVLKLAGPAVALASPCATGVFPLRFRR